MNPALGDVLAVPIDLVGHEPIAELLLVTMDNRQ